MSDLILNEQQREALIGAHCDILRGLETLRLLVDGVDSVLGVLTRGKHLEGVYQDRVDTLSYVIRTIERDLEDADEIIDPENGFRAMRKHKETCRRTETLNGGGARV